MAKANLLISLKPVIALVLMVFIATTTIIITAEAKECSAFTCGPVISKCQLLEACRCEAQLNYTCHESCANCLGDLFQDCCSCVGICPQDIESENPSHVKVLNPSNANLFAIYADEEELSEHWTVHRAPIQTANGTKSDTCIMAFLASCIDQNRCETACVTMGASGYRWFEMGCCECLDLNCPGFGINGIRCRNCPNTEQVQDINSEL